jgi:hypothetical protein
MGIASGINARLPPPQHTPRRVRLARLLAISADVLQLGLAPFFIEGFALVFDAIVDVVVCVALISLLGFNFAFLPGFFFEMLPLVDLAPTWTIAVFVATRRGASQPPVMGTEPRTKPEPPVIDV